MLVIDDGSTVGSVSGGCLERAVVEQCLAAIATKEFMLLDYDTSHDDDIVLGTGSGCPGSVQIFVEALEDASPHNPLLIFQERLGLDWLPGSQFCRGGSLYSFYCNLRRWT